MGRRNRNKRRRNPAVAPPIRAPAASTAAGDSDQPVDEEDPAYELSNELLEQHEGNQVLRDLNITLKSDFGDCKVYLQDLELNKRLISGEDCKEKYTHKWVKRAGEGLVWTIQNIEAVEIQIRQMGGMAMQRPPEIHSFITLVKRIM